MLDKINIITDIGDNVEATAPIIISASRSTDIPAFYAKWFFNRLAKGYLCLVQPFQQEAYVYFFQKCKGHCFLDEKSQANPTISERVG